MDHGFAPTGRGVAEAPANPPRSAEEAQSRPQGAAASRPSGVPSTAYIALGSNMGDREELLLQAIGLIDGEPGIEVERVSGIYETDPVGYTDQPAFLNMVLAARTSLEPIELLRTLLRLEHRLGRIRHERWGPRTIDLDLLLYDNVRMDLEELTLPHPRMMERSFVLVPLHDVIPDSHPLHGQVAEERRATTQAGKDGITLWKIINWRSASEPFES
ncbi:2-amino-4-hydroxy-6-hydroxymethyldihydropteridine diphosphokinase [Paenibacillus sp. HB172176]|uniref:2-amino-4-hydroxy-6- hydroxymethyldihydropteridine diphosphokinase n=1 Tax=Paenibacillus sp. HB172176 TaxID=2493690 RepID=UPI00143A4580|nr:2-amino-4-hydroxy-6-hydroxymethyldihydropteridine diphosphokinase [Paenibacillus sp. HB172176]